MFLHEHTHSIILDLTLLCTGLFLGMFLGYIAGTLHWHARSTKPTKLIDPTERRQATGHRRSTDLPDPA